MTELLLQERGHEADRKPGGGQVCSWSMNLICHAEACVPDVPSEACAHGAPGSAQE